MSLLELRGLSAGYGQRRVLQSIDLSVEPGEIVALLGANGAGKTTTLRAISGLVAWTGAASFAARSLRGLGTSAIARLGIAHVPESRGTFGELTVWENLRLGAVTRRDRHVRTDLAHALETWPGLAARRDQPAATLSGGEQQMLALARAMLARPRLLLLDEPSLGLAPHTSAAVFAMIRAVNARESTAVVLVEQNVQAALEISRRGYVLQHGEVVASGASDALQDNPLVRGALTP